MKPIQKVSGSYSFLLMAVMISVLMILNSCATKVSFLTSPVVPAAKGSVKVDQDKNKNYNIKVSLSNLADPSRLQPPKNFYIVWMESENDAAKNIGRINTSAGLLGGKMKSSFETVSIVKPVKIFITAEDEADVQYPGMLVVLTTENF